MSPPLLFVKLEEESRRYEDIMESKLKQRIGPLEGR